MTFRIGSAVVGAGALLVGAPAGAQQAAPTCEAGGAPVHFTGTVTTADARTYEELPFTVAAGTTRVEVAYDWHEHGPTEGPVETVLDLGLWDGDGFRGWSGSRGGRVAAGQEPVFVQPDVAARGYHPGPIRPGEWFVDLGIAAVAPLGADWEVTVTCTAPTVGAPFRPDPVDPAHVADPDPGWYHGDLHMHGHHSNARAPAWEGIVDAARAAGLDFLPITEYVTGQHWDELGAVQRANPDLLVWPGREVITYFGHANVHGETRSVLEYRHGHRGVRLADIQRASLADGALFQVNHPDAFPPPLTGFCRGCYFELGHDIDWSAVDAIEVVNGPILASSADIGAPGLPVFIQNPFTQAAIERWEALLRAGHRITAVSGSDSKGVEDEVDRRGYGSSATAVYAEELSRAALADAVRAGHAYIRTRGVDESPEIELTGSAGGRIAMMGDTLVADAAELTLTVRGGTGQVATILRDGEPWGFPVAVDADPFTFSWTADRVGATTFWRVDVADLQSLTAITNPIFLTGAAPPEPPASSPTTAEPSPGGGALPRTGGGAPPGAGVLLLVAAGALLRRRRNERTFG